MGPRSKPYTPEPLVALASLPALCTAAILIVAPRLDPEPLSGLIIGSSLLFLLPAVLLVPLRHAWPPLILTAEEGDRVLFTRLFWKHLVRAFTIGTVSAPLVMLLVGLLGRPAGLGGATRVALANYLMAASWALPFLAATGVILAACGALGARRAARVALIVAALATVATVVLVSRLDISPLYLSFAAGTAAPCFAVVFALATTRAVLATGHLSYRPFQTASDAEHPTGSAPRGPIIWPSIATGIALAILVALASRRGDTAAVAAGTILGPYFALAMLLGGLGLRRAASTAGKFDKRSVAGLYAVLGTLAVLLMLFSGSLTGVLFPTLEEDGRRVIAIALRLSALLILLEPLAAGVTGLPAGRAQRAITTSCLWLITLPAAGVMLIYLQLNAVAIVLALIAARVVAVLLGLLGVALARRADSGADPATDPAYDVDGMASPEPVRPKGPTRSRGQSRDQNRAPHSPTTSLR
ncbi:hypothetical protein [Fodinicurvata sp. EGI_FJ10296]|uniref:hypothetical protein n=1 Tax=Fodinicurvata sp. EGI_FJ10296 TaxID=3231908 RepID=UPI0034568D1E